MRRSLGLALAPHLGVLTVRLHEARRCVPDLVPRGRGRFPSRQPSWWLLLLLALPDGDLSVPRREARCAVECATGMGITMGKLHSVPGTKA